MPDKEGAQEKSTTKEVVNKKQKQMMGEEGYDVARDEGRVKPSKDKKDATSYPVSDEVRKTQKKNEGPSAFEIVKKKYGKAVMDVEKKKNVSEEGKSLLSTPGLDKLKKIKDFKSNADRVFGRKSPDLTKVAESFGGEIIGEPIELDEGVTQIITKTAKFFRKPAARRTLKQFIDIAGQNLSKFRVGATTKASNIGEKIPFVKRFVKKAREGYLKRTTTPKAKPKKPEFDTYTYKKDPKSVQKSFSDALKKNRKILNNKNKSKIGTTTKAAEVTAAGGVGTAIGTQLNKGKKGKLPKFRPRLPQTSHNIGRTSNPQ